MTRRLFVKIAFDCPLDLLEVMDAYCKAHPKVKRREIHENALRKWFIEQQAAAAQGGGR